MFPRKWEVAFLLKLEILLILRMKNKTKNMYCPNEALNCLFSKINWMMPLIGKSLNNIFVFLIMLFSELKQSHFRVTYVKSKWVDFLHCWAVVSPKRSRKSFL